MLSLFKKNLSRVMVVGLICLSFFLPQLAYGFLGIGDIVFDPGNFVPNTINTANSTSQLVRENILNPIAWFVAKQVVKKITAQTVNWINSGFEGNPAYVTDPGQFFLNIGDQAAAKFISGTALRGLCTPFQDKIRLALVKNYLSDRDKNFSCTLGRIEQNYKNFIDDFHQGGWESWFKITQVDDNNPYGAYAKAKLKLDVNIQGLGEKYQKQLDWGKGFFSFEKCVGETVHTKALCPDGSVAPVYPDGRPGLCQFGAVPTPANDECIGKKETVTPGSVIEGQLTHVLGSGVDQLNLADSINEIISSLVTSMIGRVVGGVGNGLRGLTDKSPGDTGRSFIEQFSGETSSTQTNINIESILASTPIELRSAEPTPPEFPFIILKGTNPIAAESIEQFNDPGAYAYDVKDGDISGNIDATITDQVESFTVTYSVTDSDGNQANRVTRTVNILRIATPNQALPIDQGTPATTTPQ